MALSSSKGDVGWWSSQWNTVFKALLLAKKLLTVLQFQLIRLDCSCSITQFYSTWVFVWHIRNRHTSFMLFPVFFLLPSLLSSLQYHSLLNVLSWSRESVDIFSFCIWNFFDLCLIELVQCHSVMISASVTFYLSRKYSKNESKPILWDFNLLLSLLSCN